MTAYGRTFREEMISIYGESLYEKRKPKKYDFLLTLEILTCLLHEPAVPYRIAKRIGRFLSPAIKRHLDLLVNLDLVENGKPSPACIV